MSLQYPKIKLNWLDRLALTRALRRLLGHKYPYICLNLPWYGYFTRTKIRDSLTLYGTLEGWQRNQTDIVGRDLMKEVEQYWEENMPESPVPPSSYYKKKNRIIWIRKLLEAN